MVKELLFKLDLIAPATAFLFLIIQNAIGRRNPVLSGKFLMIFLVTEIFINSLAALLQARQISNLWVYHMGCMINQVLFSYYFARLLRPGKLVFIYWGIFLFALFYLLNTIYNQGLTSFPSYAYALSAGIISIYALLFFREIINDLPTVNILSLSEFWAVTGFLTYFASSFFIFISYHYLSGISPKKVYILWQLHNIFLSLACITFMKAISCKRWILK